LQLPKKCWDRWEDEVDKSFDEVVLAWRASNGGRIPIQSEERKNLMRDLFCTLEDYGLLDDVKIKSNQNRVVNACVNPTSKKLNNWKAAVEIDLQVVMQEKFAEVTIRKASDSNWAIKAPEHRPNVRPNLTLAPPNPAPSEPETPETDADLGYTKAQRPMAVPNPDWAPTTVEDENFLEKLGLNSDE
jgi:hypothetical protein